MPKLDTAELLIKHCLETQNPYLDIGKCGLTNKDLAVGSYLGDMLAKCTHLETLIVSNRWLDEEWIDSQNNGGDNFFNAPIESISKLVNLKKLICCGDHDKRWRIQVMSFIAPLHKLIHLDVSYNQISKIEGLEGLGNLSYLVLRSNQISKIEGLEGLLNLSSLNLNSNKISKIEGLEGLVNLSSLILSSNKISKIEGLEGLLNLSSLILSSNKISKIEGLEGLLNLSNLILSSNQISKIEGLEGLLNLSSVGLSSNKISKIEGLEGLLNLSNLILSSNQISKIEGLEVLVNLSSLGLSSNQISKIEGLEVLVNLSSLVLSSNKISKIEGLEGLLNLSSLVLSRNKISEIEGLERQVNLSNLVLRTNKISKIEGLELLLNLSSLNLSFNKISKLEGLELLLNLSDLDLSSNKISKIEGLEGLLNLSSLVLSSNKISKIEGLEVLVNLSYLYLNFNEISKIEGLEGLLNLSSLGLDHIRISKIEGLEGLVNLSRLDLTYNEISKIEGLEGLLNLSSLDLSSNQISKIESLEGLVNLSSLDLSSNQISKIEGLEGLVNLSSLDLSSNQISKIEGVEGLVKLTTLNLGSNNISKIEKNIFEKDISVNVSAFGSKGILLGGNPIESPPLEIISQGREAVLKWFEATKVKLEEIKIILIGDPEAGKTSLLRRLKDNSFNEREPQTDGINIEHIDFGKCPSFQQTPSLKNLTGHFWDFGGQEIMNATHQFFLTNRSVYILLLHARKDTNNATQIRQWVKRIKATGGNSPIIVVANQCDINKGFGFENEYELQNEFPQIRFFIKSSCASGENIDLIKEKLAELIPQAELFNTEIDERWIPIMKQLQSETASNHFLPESRFKEICRNNKLINSTERDSAIRFLHDLGLILHFDNINLSEYYVLDPYWITYGVYQILTSSFVSENKGIVNINDLDYIINKEEDKKQAYKPIHLKRIDYSTNERRFLVDMLEQFKLCFYTDNKTTFFVPDLLETTEPIDITKPIRESRDAIRFVYQYDYLPKTVMPNILVSIHKFSKKMWRTGCVLEDEGCQALVVSYENRLSLHVLGEHKKKRAFLAVLRHLVNGINSELKNQPIQLIPLPNMPNEFAEYEVLLNRERRGRKEYIYHEDKPTEKAFPISELLEGVPTNEEIPDLVKLSSMCSEILSIQKKMESKLDRYHDRILAALENKNSELIAAIKELNEEQTIEINREIMLFVANCFNQFSGEMDEKMKQLYEDLKKSDNVGVKLKLAIPLIDLLGIKLETEFDIKGWLKKMAKNHPLRVFQLIQSLTF